MQGCKAVGIPCFGTLWDFVSTFYPHITTNINSRFSERHEAVATVAEVAQPTMKALWRNSNTRDTHRSFFLNVVSSLPKERHAAKWVVEIQMTQLNSMEVDKFPEVDFHIRVAITAKSSYLEKYKTHGNCSKYLRMFSLRLCRLPVWRICSVSDFRNIPPGILQASAFKYFSRRSRVPPSPKGVRPIYFEDGGRT
jgi:hypothetical protein